jgi:penicillin-binding protein 1C
MDDYIPLVSSNKNCDHEIEIFTDPDETMSYCTTCIPEIGFKKKNVKNLPAELITFYEAENIPYETVPPHNPECQRLFSDHAPIITSPIDQMSYILNVEEDPQMMLSCHAANDVSTIFWYVNDVFMGTSLPTDPYFFKPEPGRVKISCSDDKGRNSNITVSVEVF